MLPAVGESEVARAGAERAIFRLEADDRDSRAGRQRVPVPSQAHQDRWRAAFDLPALDGAIGLLHIDVQPGVRVHPLHHDHLTIERDLLVRVELGGEGVMGRGRRQRHQQGSRRASVVSFICSPAVHVHSLPSFEADPDRAARRRTVTHLCSSSCASRSIIAVQRHLDRPWSRVGLRVVERRLVPQVVRPQQPEPLRHRQLVTGMIAGAVQP